MSVTYGFYDSVNHDRTYNAMQMSSIFDGIIKDGVFMSIGDHLNVTANEGMVVNVGTGRCWFNHTWTLNDALYRVTVPDAELILNRIDALVVDINQEEAVRANEIIIVKGTPSSNPDKPELIRTATHNQYPLAYITVRAGVTKITQANIENAIGTESTPYITGILQTIDATALLEQWRAQYEETRSSDHAAYVKQREEDDQAFSEWFATKQSELVAWLELEKSDILAWYENLKVQLDGNVAANLQGQIDRIQPITIDVIDSILEGTYNA